MPVPEPLREAKFDALRIRVYPDRASLGRAAAADVSRAMTESVAAAEGRPVPVIFAAAPSQTEFLSELCARKDLDWSRVVALHMDEYLGLPPSHPASFRRYLREHLFDRVPLAPEQLRLIPGEQTGRPLATCLQYEDQLRANPPRIVCAGIGENGHLAFNDPPVADFADPVSVKVVRLDEACRVQQVHDGCFATIDEVPRHAYTLTVPALLAAPVVAVMVPGIRKAEAVRRTLLDPVGEACPATALRRHPGAVLYLDRESASLLP